MRLSATTSLLAYDDTIVVASVSANYGLGNPKEYLEMIEKFEVGESYHQKSMLLRLVEMGYKRNDSFFDRGDFRVNGEVVDIYPAYSEDEVVRLEFFGDELEKITILDSIDKKPIRNLHLKITISLFRLHLVNIRKVFIISTILTLIITI